MMKHLPARLLLFALGSLGCALTSPGRTALAARVLFHDPLTGGRSQAKVVGGKFEAEGWRCVTGRDTLHYVLPEGLEQGSVVFEAKGFKLGAPGDPRKHIWGLFDVAADGRYNESNCNGVMLRFYSGPKKRHKPGETRFRIRGTKYRKRQKDTRPLVWEADRWYRFQMTWTQSRAIWKRDGKAIATLSYRKQGVAFRHLYINLPNYGGMAGAADIVFKNVVITDDPRFAGPRTVRPATRKPARNQKGLASGASSRQTVQNRPGPLPASRRPTRAR